MESDGARLAALEHENMVEAESMLASFAPESFIERIGGVAVIATGLPVNSLNFAVVEEAGGSTAAIAAAVDKLGARAFPFVVNLRTGIDDRFVPLMATLGLAPIPARGPVPGMAMSALPRHNPPISPGFDIIPVTDDEAVRDHRIAITAGFQLSADFASALVNGRLLERADAVFYTGYAAGQPVSTGVGLRTGRTIGIYNISTAPEWRRRGFAEAMTRRVMTDGARAGCDVGVLQASRIGLPIYERIGFSTVVEYVSYGAGD